LFDVCQDEIPLTTSIPMGDRREERQRLANVDSFRRARVNTHALGLPSFRRKSAVTLPSQNQVSAPSKWHQVLEEERTASRHKDERPPPPPLLIKMQIG